MQYVGEVNAKRVFKCCKCGEPLRDDHGFMSADGPVCANTVRCSLRVSRRNLEAQAAQGIKPRWRT